MSNSSLLDETMPQLEPIQRLLIVLKKKEHENQKGMSVNKGWMIA